MSIAATYHMTLQWLEDLNRITNNTIYVGQKLYLAPVGAKVTLPQDQADGQTEGMLPTEERDALGRIVHVVTKGETVFSISHAYHTDLYALINLNKVKGYTVHPGDKIIIPQAPSKEEPSKEGSGSARVAPDEDSVLKSREASTSHQASSEVLLGQASPVPSRPRVQSGTIPLPKRGVVQNPDFDRLAPANPNYLFPVGASVVPPPIRLADLLAPLPLLDKGSYRSTWTKSQLTIANWWGKQVFHTRAILRTFAWIGDQGDSVLLLSVSPAPDVRAVVQVVVPGAYLKQEIDTLALRHYVAAGCIVDMVGHLNYLDGPEPVSAIRRGVLLSPWELVLRTLRIHPPTGYWITLTKGPFAPQTKETTPTPASPAAADPGPKAPGQAPEKIGN